MVPSRLRALLGFTFFPCSIARVARCLFLGFRQYNNRSFCVLGCLGSELFCDPGGLFLLNGGTSGHAPCFFCCVALKLRSLSLGQNGFVCSRFALELLKGFQSRFPSQCRAFLKIRIFVYSH